jgi:hypothetical protein
LDSRRFEQARLANQVLPAQLVKRNRRLLMRPVRLFSEVCIYPSRVDAPANDTVALHIDNAHACVDDTRKGVGQPVACYGPPSADRTAAVTV